MGLFFYPIDEVAQEVILFIHVKVVENTRLEKAKELPEFFFNIRISYFLTNELNKLLKINLKKNPANLV